MAQRAWNLRYFAQRLGSAGEEVMAQLQSSAGSLPEALVKGMETFRAQLTGVVVLTGAAMQPTLNAGPAAAQGDRIEKLLVRLIPRPAANRTVFDGDVVAFASPIAGPASSPAVLVRRVAALEGDEMASDDAEDEAFAVPQGHCWVLADNEDLAPCDAVDSRTFGPLPLQNIQGRVMYYARDETDHGPVENSEAGMALDSAVLEAELDLQRLVGGGEGDGEGEERP